jgi:hypothetical protein
LGAIVADMGGAMPCGYCALRGLFTL